MSKIKEKAKPYLYEAGDKLAILVHGFLGTPDDMRELASYLVKRGISAKAIRLAGHGTTDLQDLEDSSYYDWWKTLADEIGEASGRYSKIYLIGYSFGANLSFDLAARNPNLIHGVVSLGISVYLRRELLIKLLLPFFHFFFKKAKRRDINKRDFQKAEDSGGHLFIPTKSLYQFYDFIDSYTKKGLHKVTTPSLIIHSRKDSVSRPISSKFAYSKINSSKKELIILDDMNHNPIRSQRRDLIFSKISKFIESL